MLPCNLSVSRECARWSGNPIISWYPITITKTFYSVRYKNGQEIIIEDTKHEPHD